MTGDERRTMDEQAGRKSIPIEELKYVKAPNHLCLIYDNQEEWQAFISSFLRVGLERNERCLIIYDTHSAKQLRDTLRSVGIELSSVESSGKLVLVHGSRFHIKDGLFDPEKTLDLLTYEVQNALRKGFSALRVTTETEWVLQQFPGSERLLEYEAKTNLERYQQTPCLVVCQFERGKFSTEMIKGIMQTHSLVIRGDQVYRNIYYVAPEQFLKESHTEIRTLDWFNYAEREVRMEKELHESAKRLQLLFENAMAVILVVDETGYYIDANRSALEFMECTMEDLKKMSIWDTIPEKNGPIRGMPFQMLLSPRLLEAEYIINSKRKTILLNLVPVTSGGKNVVYGIGQEITKRKEMERSLRESQERWQFALEGAGDGVWDWDLASDHVYFSGQWKAMLGYQEDEIGDSVKEWESRIHPEDRDKVIGEWTKYFEGKVQVYSCEHRVKCKDGSYKWILDRGKIVSRSPEGKPLRAIGTHTDVTQSRKMSEALLQSERNFRAMIENNNDAIFVLAGEQANIVYCNRQTSDLMGYTREELLMLTLSDLVAPHERSRLMDNYHRRMKGENLPNRYEVDIVDQMGNPRVVEVTGAKTSWHNSDADLVIFRDVTERNRFERELRLSEEKLRTIIESISDGIVIADLDGVITDVNNKGLRLSRAAYKEDMLGKNILQFVAPGMESFARDSFLRCLEIGVLENIEILLRRYDGSEYPGELSGNMITDNLSNPAGVVIAFRDITERKKAREDMEELYRKEKSHRLELEQEARSRGLFIDVLAHELRTPLTPIQVSSGMLRELISPGSDDMMSKLINNLNKGVQTLSRRLEELLDIGRFDRSIFKLDLLPVDMAAFFECIVKRHKRMVEERGRVLVADIEADLPRAMIDRDRIEQVITNLLSNASQSSPEGGEVKLKAMTQNDGLVVEVTDYGPGITPEERERLFNPYHRIEQDRQKFPGIGLGLAVSKQIVKAHGGWIQLISEKGAGNTFSFFVPVLLESPRR
ncbi:MAG: PAS domain S-box protein [Dehalococcoidales bacterium]|nr:PAS domain S-box protein [Dehalococcoidales bacterium]